ncbi:hypothetical protein [Streptosporangium roseum]|uniref:hypothetical protein n=1 Tax=Streptosporangium roseum TaxID=2001 RepID=UPI0004CDA9D4|nr:hypothetical protein [Streptosporangium roseum]
MNDETAALLFDVVGFDLWVSLCHGLRLELLGRDDALDGRAVARRIEEAGVTLMTATPTRVCFENRGVI